ncbi:GNAT family N-acetyltransferase [Zunongwangia pacifica]|uniref:GNAT family N-acetyltransferase n=1 Tax=Zunongwangia pacifica TaxID=2911062 RepID=A0A9X2CQ23_9FLAO|nr:GNAT family N-acetyltransferase [Zunongwangia pacifica]MCL6218943.1 GNAT family N-acetyltransferase [Zunongwangia pacifica]
MEFGVSSNIIEKWLRAWSLSRQVSLPVRYKSGFRVDVGEKKQKVRYVFPVLNKDFFQLSKNISDPWIFLKVCASPEEFKDIVSPKWKIQPQGYMMSCLKQMTFQNGFLGSEYTLEKESYNSTYVIRVVTYGGQLASIGRVVLLDDMAVYDRIITDINHRKKGLATFVMSELEKIAISKGVFKNFLVATEEGKILYESLGWELYSLYSSIVITN